VSTRTLLLSVALVVFCSFVHAQPQPVPLTQDQFPTQREALPPTAGVRVPPEPSVEQLLDELERLQAQKAALEKKEQDLKAVLRQKLQKQTERLNKLGVAPIPTVPERVGLIIIEGNTKTPDKRILDKLGMRPGEVLRYPALEEARARLIKAGFRDATVEILPNKSDSQFKDIRVRVDESKPRPTPAPVPVPAPGDSRGY